MQSTLDHDVAIRLNCRHCFRKDCDGVGQDLADVMGWTDVYETQHGVRRSLHQWWNHEGCCPQCTKLKRKGKL